MRCLPLNQTAEVSSNILSRRGWKEFAHVRGHMLGFPSMVGTPDLAEYSKTKFSNGERETELLVAEEDPNDPVMATSLI